MVHSDIKACHIFLNKVTPSAILRHAESVSHTLLAVWIQLYLSPTWEMWRETMKRTQRAAGLASYPRDTLVLVTKKSAFGEAIKYKHTLEGK